MDKIKSIVGENGKLMPPFPYYGGKRRIGDFVWSAIGEVETYIEPFFGSGAVYLSRPRSHFFNGIKTEIINDKDSHVVNFWRSIKNDPQTVIKYADWPANHVDLVSRRKTVVMTYDYLAEKLENDKTGEWFDPKLAGYWLWVLSTWIAINPKDGSIKTETRPNLHENALYGFYIRDRIPEFLMKISERLQRTKIYYGDWDVVCEMASSYDGPVGIFLDPPYDPQTGRSMRIYATDSESVSSMVKSWCLKNGSNPNYRIVLTGYDGEHNEVESQGWSVYKWSSRGIRTGSGGSADRKWLERIWVSPYCLRPNLAYLPKTLKERIAEKEKTTGEGEKLFCVSEARC